jgi:N-acetylneuraminic acid mutarotase
MNGVGKIGSKLYHSGGLRGGEAVYSSELHAYDYAGDRMIRKASMPKFTGDGVTGVINGKLYVLPGTCSTEDGSCDLEPIRQLYRYDPATNTGSPGGHRLTFTRMGPRGSSTASCMSRGASKMASNPLPISTSTTPRPTAGRHWLRCPQLAEPLGRFWEASST